MGEMGKIQVNWAKEHSQYLCDNLGSGGSYAEIASAMNIQFNTNYTRNALIGRAARMGLVSKHVQKYAPRKPQVYKPRARKPKLAPAFEPIEIIEIRCAEITPRLIPLLDLAPHDCRYPYGDRDFTFCGHPKMPGSSYCEAHFHLARGQWRPRSQPLLETAA